MDETRLSDAARRLTDALTPGDLEHTLRQITATAVEVIPEVEFASITIAHSDGRLSTSAPTDDCLLKLDAAQYELREGPCYQAAVDTTEVISTDLATDERFPQYAAVALEQGIRAQAGLNLFDAPRSKGALNLYAGSVGAFADLDSLAPYFAHQFGTAIAYAREIESLNDALSTRSTIGQAMGILMERYQLTDDRAFAFLTRLSQDNNIKLRVVAAEVVAEVQQRSGSTAPETLKPRQPGTPGQVQTSTA